VTSVELDLKVLSYSRYELQSAATDNAFIEHLSLLLHPFLRS
jgi:hypothetical protein